MLTLITLLIYGSSSHAMCVHKTYQTVAWNKPGTAALIRETASGPEGGGATIFYVFDFAKKTSESFSVSSTFSPGDGTEPQSVSPDECTKTAAAGNQTLNKLGFKIKFNADMCKSKSRSLIPSSTTTGMSNGPHTLTYSENASCQAACRWSFAGHAGACF